MEKLVGSRERVPRPDKYLLPLPLQRWILECQKSSRRNGRAFEGSRALLESRHCEYQLTWRIGRPEHGSNDDGPNQGHDPQDQTQIPQALAWQNDKGILAHTGSQEGRICVKIVRE